jgi:hypothetical protein
MGNRGHDIASPRARARATVALGVGLVPVTATAAIDLFDDAPSVA